MVNPPTSKLCDSRTEKQRKVVLKVAHVRDCTEEYEVVRLKPGEKI